MRTRIKCPDCERTFVEQWRASTHICESGILARLREWRRWRNMDRFDKFMHDLQMAEPQLANKVARAMDSWQKSRPPSCVVDIEDELDPIGERSG